MSEAFETARMKARKLAALASAGVDGERENAIRLLEAHLKKHGLTMAALGDESRKMRMLDCVVDPKKLIKDPQLRDLACQTMYSDAPADPRCQKVWKKRGMHLADAALTVARNDDCSALLHDEDAMPVSVCLLAMIYGVSDDVSANAVRHWIRRPNEPALGLSEKSKS